MFGWLCASMFTKVPQCGSGFWCLYSMVLGGWLLVVRPWLPVVDFWVGFGVLVHVKKTLRVGQNTVCKNVVTITQTLSPPPLTHLFKKKIK